MISELVIHPGINNFDNKITGVWQNFVLQQLVVIAVQQFLGRVAEQEEKKKEEDVA